MLLLIAIIFIIAGCHNPTNNLKITKLSWCIPNNPECLDPGLCGPLDGTDIINNTFEGLFRVSTKDTPTLAAAESYSISKDNKVYIFKIKDDAYWSDGKKLLPIDFEFAWKRVVDSNIPAPKKNLLKPIKNALDIIEGKKDKNTLGVIALNDKYLKVELEYPINYLPHLLSLITFMPVRNDLVDNEGLWAKNPITSISNGPFCLNYLSNTHLILKKNNFYHGSNNSNIDKVTVKFIDDANTAYIEYISNKLDIIDNIPLEEGKRLALDPEFISVPYYGLYFYSFNLTIDCLKDRRVRLAISKSIDRNLLVEKIRKINEVPANQYIPPGLTYDFNYNIYNPDEARKLFKEAGFNQNNKFPTIEIFFNSENMNKIIAEVIQNMLNKNLGINVSLTGQEWSVFIEKRKHLQYNGLVKNSHFYEYMNPLSFFEMFKSEGESYSGYVNKNFDLLLNKFNHNQIDTEHMFELKSIIEEDYPIIPLFFYSSSSLVKKYIKNYMINSIGYKYLGEIIIP